MGEAVFWVGKIYPFISHYWAFLVFAAFMALVLTRPLRMSVIWIIQRVDAGISRVFWYLSWIAGAPWKIHELRVRYDVVRWLWFLMFFGAVFGSLPFVSDQAGLAIIALGYVVALAYARTWMRVQAQLLEGTARRKDGVLAAKLQHRAMWAIAFLVLLIPCSFRAMHHCFGWYDLAQDNVETWAFLTLDLLYKSLLDFGGAVEVNLSPASEVAGGERALAFFHWGTIVYVVIHGITLMAKTDFVIEDEIRRLGTPGHISKLERFGKRVVRQLKAVLARNEDSAAMAAAAIELGQIRQETGMRAKGIQRTLLALLNSGDPQIMIGVAEALGTGWKGDKDVADKLLSAFQNKGHPPKLRVAFIKALRHFKAITDPQLEVLADGIDDTSRNVRANTAMTLSELDPPQSDEIKNRMCAQFWQQLRRGDVSAAFRNRLGSLLREYGDERIQSETGTAIGDLLHGSFDLKVAAARKLRFALRDPEAVSALCAALCQDGNIGVRLEIIRALREVASQDEVKPKLQTAKALRSWIRASNTGESGRLEATARKAAIKALGEFEPDQETLDLLAELLPNTCKVGLGLRQVAVATLERLKGTRALLGGLIRKSGTLEPNILDALERLLPPDALAILSSYIEERRIGGDPDRELDPVLVSGVHEVLREHFGKDERDPEDDNDAAASKMVRPRFPDPDLTAGSRATAMEPSLARESATN